MSLSDHTQVPEQVETITTPTSPSKLSTPAVDSLLSSYRKTQIQHTVLVNQTDEEKDHVQLLKKYGTGEIDKQDLERVRSPPKPQLGPGVVVNSFGKRLTPQEKEAQPHPKSKKRIMQETDAFIEQTQKEQQKTRIEKEIINDDSSEEENTKVQMINLDKDEGEFRERRMNAKLWKEQMLRMHQQKRDEYRQKHG